MPPCVPRSVGNIVRIGRSITSKAKLRQVNPLVEADANPDAVDPSYMSVHKHFTVEANRKPLPI